jgi:hypothetical protein
MLYCVGYPLEDIASNWCQAKRLGLLVASPLISG